VAIGIVKWFNPTKGYGFIQPDNGGKDVFVHISAVERAGLSTLNEGARVSYEEKENRGKTSAEAQKSGASTLREIAAALKARGVATARGGQWHVKSVFERPTAGQRPRASPVAISHRRGKNFCRLG